jgi:hypothetical protein
MASIYEALLERMPPFQPVLLGHDAHGDKIELGSKDFYHHVHLLGLSGRGKSRAIEFLVQQLITNRAGVTLIDPHGSMYEALVDWLTWMGDRDERFLEDRTIHLFDPADPEFSPGYNPFAMASAHEAQDRVKWFLDAMAQALGGEDTHVMQWYHMIFTATMYALADKGATPLEALLLAPHDEEPLRNFVFRNLPNRVHQQAWQRISGWKAREYEEKTSSFFTRMHDLFQSPALQRVLGATHNLLDPLKVMDGGHTVLINLKPRTGFDEEASVLLGKILVNAYQQTARNKRVADKARPHIFIIDECHDYLSGDIPRILDGTRKYGLHMLLSHQRIEQLYEVGPNTADAVLAGAQTKIIMGSTYKTGTMIADEIFGGQYDLEALRGPKTPHVIGHNLVLRHGGSETEGRNHSRSTTDSLGLTRAQGRSKTEAEGESQGHVGSESSGTAETENFNPENGTTSIASTLNKMTGSADSYATSYVRARAESSSEAVSRQRSVAEQEGTSQASTKSWQETLEPIIAFLQTSTKTIDEWRHESAVAVQKLDVQSFILKRSMQSKVLLGRVETFNRYLVDSAAVWDLTRRLMRTTGINTPSLQVEAEIEARWAALRKMAVDPLSLGSEGPDVHKGVEWR